MHLLTRHHLERKRQALKPDPIIAVIVQPSELNEDPPSPKIPTSFWCGSPAKVELMRERVEAGESVFQSIDCGRKIMRHPDVWDKRKPWE